jgi:hypothetical protein
VFVLPKKFPLPAYAAVMVCALWDKLEFVAVVEPLTSVFV